MQDKMQFVVAWSLPPFGIDVPRSSSMPCRSACPRNRTEFHKRLGETQQFECVRNSAEEETRATKEKEAGKTLDFTAIGSRKCDYTGQSCALGRAYPRKQSVAMAEVPRYVCKDMLNADTQVIGGVEFARQKDARGFRTCTPQRVRAVQAHRETNARIFFFHRGSRDIVACLAAEGRRLFFFLSYPILRELSLNLKNSPSPKNV